MAKKNVKAPKSWDALRNNWEKMEQMACVPKDIHKMRVGTIIDEEKSVRWNREEVERNNAAYDEAVAQLNREKNACRDAVAEDIYYTIQCEVGCGLTRNQALKIWTMAYSEGHAFGWSDIMCYLEQLMELAKMLLTKDEKR